MRSFTLFFLIFFQVFCIFLAKNTFAQLYSVADCKSDFEFIKNVAQKVHGGIYQNISPREFEQRMTEIEKQIKKPMQANAFFSLLTSGFQGLGLDHTSISMPENSFRDLLMTNGFFPLPLFFMQGKAYLDYDFLEIPLGTEITHINNKKISDVVPELLNLPKGELEKGDKADINFRSLEDNFPIWYYLKYGIKPIFEVTFITPNTTKSQKIKLNAINSRAVNGRKLKVFSKSSEAYKEDIHYRYLDSLNTLVVSLNTFQADSTKFVQMWDNIAQGCEELKARHLVLDLRQNTGGYMALGGILYGYFIDTPYQDKLLSEVRTLKLVEKNQIVSFNNSPANEQEINNVEDYLRTKFVQTPNERGIYTNKKDFDVSSQITPRPKRINTNIYILVGGNTYSTAVSFSRLMYNNKQRQVTFVGEETGSGYYGHTANIMVNYKLPKTGLLFEIPLVHVEFTNLKKDFPKQSGLIPQIQVRQNIADYLKGKDTVMDYVLSLVKK